MALEFDSATLLPFTASLLLPLSNHNDAGKGERLCVLLLNG